MYTLNLIHITITIHPDASMISQKSSPEDGGSTFLFAAKRHGDPCRVHRLSPSRAATANQIAFPATHPNEVVSSWLKSGFPFQKPSELEQRHPDSPLGLPVDGGPMEEGGSMMPLMKGFRLWCLHSPRSPMGIVSPRLAVQVVVSLSLRTPNIPDIDK